MDPEEQPSVGNDQPVAYDAEGQPLYHRPELPVENATPAVNDNDTSRLELHTDHGELVKDYPDMLFSKTEHVIIDIQRTIWGLVIIWVAAIAAFIAILVFAFTMVAITDVDHFIVFIIVVTLGAVCMAGGAVGQYVYRQNFFVVTNKRIFQRIQSTLFSFRTQNIEIARIEDCSYRQNGPLQMILDYGTIRLSTIGNEQTYRFTFVARPSEQFKAINGVVQTTGRVTPATPAKYRKYRKFHSS